MRFRRTVRILLFLGLLRALGTAVLAQNAAVTPDAAGVNETLLDATGPYEDMVGPALTGNAKNIAKLLSDADAQADAVKKDLPADAAKQFDGFLQSIHEAFDAKSYKAVAQNSLAIFHLLVDNLKADALKIPKEVSLLDYAGYQLEVLAAADKPDWDAMKKVAADAERWWNAIASKISDKNLRAAVTSTIRGIKQAAEEQNLAMAKFAARIDLDLVDLLEGAF
jgi:hypothetical protein